MFRLAAAARTSIIKRGAQMQRRTLACTTMYIRGLPHETTEDELRAMSEKFGPVYSVNIMPVAPKDRFAVAFVKFYAGALPTSTIDIVRLPYPPPDEIDAAFACGQNMIREMDGVVWKGWRLVVGEPRNNSPDNIQYKVRQAHRKKYGHADKSKRQASPSDAIEGTGPYADGYRAGFNDGVQKAQTMY